MIGSRHGEKLHETLLSRGEMVKAEDQGGYFRVPLDARSLQYDLYFDEGETRMASLDDYIREHRAAHGRPDEGAAADDPRDSKPGRGQSVNVNRCARSERRFHHLEMLRHVARTDEGLRQQE